MLFTTSSSSIHGRGTTVFYVVDRDEKVSYQDREHDQVLGERRNESHPNVVPVKAFKQGKTCTTLDAIRELRHETPSGFPVENHVQTIHVSEPKRPVRYFWGVHDFVRGLRGALLGHEYLTSIGILHRDITENNIVLARRPGEERGYLIDFGLTTPPIPEDEPHVSIDEDSDSSMKPSSSTSKPLKGPCTGMMQYMSYNVLCGGTHMHYDDMESFLYVLILFFFSYSGPLSKQELQDADKHGFVQPLGSTRLGHMRPWPETYISWTKGNMHRVGLRKGRHLDMQDGRFTIELKICMDKNWPVEELQYAIRFLVTVCRGMFANGRRSSGGEPSAPLTRVGHREFIRSLDWWLKEFGELEEKYSSCPF